MADQLKEESLVVTKTKIFEYIKEHIRSSRASGVPEDGIAWMLADWFFQHIKHGTKVKEGT